MGFFMLNNPQPFCWVKLTCLWYNHLNTLEGMWSMLYDWAMLLLLYLLFSTIRMLMKLWKYNFQELKWTVINCSSTLYQDCSGGDVLMKDWLGVTFCCPLSCNAEWLPFDASCLQLTVCPFDEVMKLLMLYLCLRFWKDNRM
jgi:hypothetical protein